MIINNNAQIYSLYTNKVDQVSTKSVENGVATNQSATSDTVEISQHGKNAEAKWQEVANKYDVTNISANERADMSRELHQNGLIPDDVMIFMVMPSSINGDLDQKTNFIGRVKESFELEKSTGLSQKQMEMRVKSIEILDRLEGLM